MRCNLLICAVVANLLLAEPTHANLPSDCWLTRTDGAAIATTFWSNDTEIRGTDAYECACKLIEWSHVSTKTSYNIWSEGCSIHMNEVGDLIVTDHEMLYEYTCGHGGSPCADDFVEIDGQIPENFGDGQLAGGVTSVDGCRQACDESTPPCLRFAFVSDPTLTPTQRPADVCYLFSVVSVSYTHLTLPTILRV